MQLIYQSHPRVTFATNVFVNVPIIFQFDETPLISVVKEEQLGFTTEIPIFHADGTYLARVRGTRVFATEEGKKAGIQLRSLAGQTVCEIAGKTAFEIHHQPGDAFRAHAELHTPNGYLVKFADSPMASLMNTAGGGLQVAGMHISHCEFEGMKRGIWLKSNGELIIGSN